MRASMLIVFSLATTARYVLVNTMPQYLSSISAIVTNYLHNAIDSCLQHKLEQAEVCLKQLCPGLIENWVSSFR